LKDKINLLTNFGTLIKYHKISKN